MLNWGEFRLDSPPGRFRAAAPDRCQPSAGRVAFLFFIGMTLRFIASKIGSCVFRGFFPLSPTRSEIVFSSRYSSSSYGRKRRALCVVLDCGRAAKYGFRDDWNSPPITCFHHRVCSSRPMVKWQKMNQNQIITSYCRLLTTSYYGRTIRCAPHMAVRNEPIMQRKMEVHQGSDDQFKKYWNKNYAHHRFLFSCVPR